MTTRNRGTAALVLAIAAVGAASAATPRDGTPLIVTASNTSANQLMVYDATGTLLSTIPTLGQGGVKGNSGGIAQDANRLAVVNFGSGNVSVFRKGSAKGLALQSVVPALASPVSVAFGHDHLYVLTTTLVESHPIVGGAVSATPDGTAALVVGDGSAAQVGVMGGELIISEKSNAIETVNLTLDGAITGGTSLIANIPSNVNAPFGLVTRGTEAYVSIAHANEISLVRNNAVLTVTGSGTQSAPCWLALDGSFLYSANSPSQSVSLYAVTGRAIVQQVAVAASFQGNPTDLAYSAGLLAVVDGNGTVSHVSIFTVDEDGGLTTSGVATISTPTTNGIAVVTAR